MRGKGISSSGLADALGLGAKTKDIVLILVEQENKEKIFSAVQEACENEKKILVIFALWSRTQW